MLQESLHQISPSSVKGGSTYITGQVTDVRDFATYPDGAGTSVLNGQVSYCLTGRILPD
jgi:hypothetical protein